MISPDKSPVIQPEFKTPWDVAQFTLGVTRAVIDYARHDQLTGLLNKASLREEIDQRIAEQKPIGLIFMDMDAFKLVNDTLGHNRGDDVLTEFGSHLRAHFRRQDDSLAHERLIQGKPQEDHEGTASRNGGDEFVVIEDLDVFTPEGKLLDPQLQLDNSLEYAREVVKKFVGAQAPDIQALKFDVSIGGALWRPGYPASSSDLLKRADQAMYETKSVRRAA